MTGRGDILAHVDYNSRPSARGIYLLYSDLQYQRRYNSRPLHEEHLADEADEDEKTAHYKPQMEIYAKALQAIYHKPVADKNLVFLRTGRQVSC